MVTLVTCIQDYPEEFLTRPPLQCPKYILFISCTGRKVLYKIGKLPCNVPIRVFILEVCDSYITLPAT
jgi:hypothetical protein